MKILTKKWAEELEQVKFIGNLKETSGDYDSLEADSKKSFFDYIREDEDLAEMAFNSNLEDELYDAFLDRNKGILASLPCEITSQIKNEDILGLGFAIKEDKELLDCYIKKQLKHLEELAEESHCYLPDEFNCLISELVYEEYIDGRNYFINIDDNVICVENYQIIEREDFEIYKLDMENPVSPWTYLEAVELYKEEEGFELHLMFVNGDRLENKTRWYFTLRGTRVKFA